MGNVLPEKTQWADPLCFWMLADTPVPKKPSEMPVGAIKGVVVKPPELPVKPVDHVVMPLPGHPGVKPVPEGDKGDL